MLRNLKLTNGYLCSEALMIRLGERIGRQHAHDAVYQAAMRAHDEGVTLKEAVLRDAEIRDRFTESEIDALLDPTQYLGSAGEFVDRVTGSSAVEEPVR